MPSPEDSEHLLRRLAALSTPAPPDPPWRVRGKKRDGATPWELIGAMLRPAAKDMGEPSSRPLIFAAAFMLRHWLAPCAALALPPLLSLSQPWLIVVWLGALVHSALFNWQLRRSLWDPGAVQPGVYAPAGPKGERIALRLRQLHASLKLTPWLLHGDWHTLLPFMFYRAPKIPYTRLWFAAPALGDRGCAGADARAAARAAPTLPVGTSETEVLAHDWAFPSGGHDPAQPIALVLHGLNGGSAEPLVRDFVAAATARGWSCVVLNARGLGGTELSSRVPFHGARTSDVAALATLVAAAAPGVPIVGVGYSMGAIVLANYLGVAGKQCPLSAAVAVSGCFDGAANARNDYGSHAFEPFLAHELKQNFTCGPRAAVLGAGRVDLARCNGPRVCSIADFDQETVVTFFGFASLDDYYRHLSVGHLGKLERVALLALHAVDDPIVDSNTFARSLAAPLPPDVFLLLTRRGGHVGWCEGVLPCRHRWSFQNRAIFEFADVVLPPSAPAAPAAAPRAARSPSRRRAA